MGKEMSEQTRVGRVLGHFRHNVVGYLALFIAVTMTPLPSYAHGLIGTAQLKNGAVTNPKIAANAVATGKIANGTVKKIDLAPGAVGAAKLATITEVVVASTTTGAGLTKGVTATCPAGTVIIGGGFDGGGIGNAWRVHRSHRDVANGWRVFGTNQTAGDTFIEAKAYCLSQ
jgi:hypothetical protein